MKIGVFTEYDEPYKEVASLTVPVLREYCERHGYDLTVTKDPVIERSIVWDRVRVIQRAMGEAPNYNKYDWIVHIDTDVLITNLGIPLTDFTTDFVLTLFILTECEREDGSRHLNDGVLFVGDGGVVHKVLEEAWNMAGPEVLCLQDALELKRKTHGQGAHGGFFKVLPQRCFNSFLYPEYGMSKLTRGNWTPGDFILHLPGINNVRRVEILKEKIPQILR